MDEGLPRMRVFVDGFGRLSLKVGEIGGLEGVLLVVFALYEHHQQQPKQPMMIIENNNNTFSIVFKHFAKP